MTRQLPTRTNYFYQQFINAASRNFSYHWKDMERLYRFIRVAYMGGTRLSYAELEVMLIDEGFPPDIAKDLSQIYHHGRELLKTPVNLSGWQSTKEKDLSRR